VRFTFLWRSLVLYSSYSTSVVVNILEGYALDMEQKLTKTNSKKMNRNTKTRWVALMQKVLLGPVDRDGKLEFDSCVDMWPLDRNWNSMCCGEKNMKRRLPMANVH